MASSLFLLLDDIATLLDDVALMTKMAARKSAAMADDVGVMTQVAARKTAGVLGDDLALNAQQVSGVKADRELPVVWAVAKGSFLNKLILVPAALAISAWLPWAITPLLMLGGAYLCFEGVEKLVHSFWHKADHPGDASHAALTADVTPDDVVKLEREKIKGAIRTDFILSAEIIVIALGTVAGKPLSTQLAVLASVAILMTVGVYGLVGGIVKLDDLGVYLSQRASAAAQSVGRALLWFAPFLMRALSVLGTAAMFLVGGGILVHGVPALHHLVAEWAKTPAFGWALEMLANGAVGIVAGALVLGAVTAVKRLLKRSP